MYIICTVLVNLGYFLDISKCVLAPVTQTQHVGMIVEFIAQAFRTPEEKIKIAPLREQVLLRQSTMSLKSLQRLMGKCISFSLAFPAAKFGGNSKGFQRMRGEFVPGFARRDCVIRWRSERHVAISFTSNAKSFQWAAVTFLPSGTISVGDYWDEDLRNEHINVKEMWAVLKGLQSLPESVSSMLGRDVGHVLES